MVIIINITTNKLILHNNLDGEEGYVNLQTGEALDWNKVKLLPNNALLKSIPEFWCILDFEKNKEIGIDIWKLSKSSGKKAWWYCYKCNDSYPSVVSNKTSGYGCSICVGRYVTPINSLHTLNPNLALQWHLTKNGDLTPHNVTSNSNKKVWWICENRHEWEATVSSRNSGNKCPYCSNLWACKENSLATLDPSLALEWHPTKNGVLTPHDVTYGSSKKVWWKCSNNHEWDSAISNRKKGHGCPYCAGQKAYKGETDMWTTNPLQASWLLNPEDGYKYKVQSNKRVDWKCPNCDSIIKNKKISDVYNQNLPCPSCSDGYSFPERIMYNVLRFIGANFETQKTFDWSNMKRYDFYLTNHNIIIETHGKQHSTDDFSFIGGKSLDEEQSNDKVKYDLAKINGISEYLVIDCRKSKFEYIKYNILQSRVAELFDLDQIDWNKVELQSHKTFLRTVSELWNKGLSISEIVESTNIGYDSIRESLINGAKLKICDYTTKEAHLRGNKVFNRPVVQLTLDGEFVAKFESIKEASNGSAGMRVGISDCCRGVKIQSHGFRWLFEKDYYKFLNGEIQLKVIKAPYDRKISQLDLEGNFIKDWNSLNIASEELNINKTYIKMVCDGQRNKTGGFKWKYVE